MRSIEGTPAGHDNPHDNENLEDDTNLNEGKNESTGEEDGDEALRDEDEEAIEGNDDDEDKDTPEEVAAFKTVNRVIHIYLTLTSCIVLKETVF